MTRVDTENLIFFGIQPNHDFLLENFGRPKVITRVDTEKFQLLRYSTLP